MTLTITLITWLLLHHARASRSVLLSRPVDSLLLEQHNIFRQEEKASNIFKMHWNQSVAEAAGRWADRCEFKHEFGGVYGENLFYSSNPDDSFDIREILLGGLEVWHDEKRGWRYSSDACGAACHYTQMVWYSTNSVGCVHKMCHGLKVGSRRVERALYLVCFYYPRGNWIGEYPFKKGRPCSNCGSGTCQDGLCVKETTSFSSYHSASENEVKAGAAWKWSYDARGDNSHHRASSSHNVTSTSSRRNGWHHSSSRHHSKHEVSYTSSDGGTSHRRYFSRHSYSSRHSSSSTFNATHNHHLRRPAELRQGKLTHASGGNLQRQLADYVPSRSDRVRSSSPASLRQRSRPAQYARDDNTIIGNNNNRHRVSNGGGVQQDQGRRRDRSPLEVLREGTHWCRDRLPACRMWASKCIQSKAVYIACPRTCGLCKNGQKDNQSQPSALQDHPQQNQHPRPQRQPQPQPKTVRQRQEPQSRSQTLRQRQEPQHPRPQALRQRQDVRRSQLQVKGRHSHGNRGKVQRGRKGKAREMDRASRARKRLERRKQRRQQRQNRRRQRLQGGRKRGGHRRRHHKKFRTVDRKAENLAEQLRTKAFNGGACADDPKYTQTCPFWVQKGFCNGNELVSTVFCQQSCGSC